MREVDSPQVANHSADTRTQRGEWAGHDVNGQRKISKKKRKQQQTGELTGDTSAEQTWGAFLRGVTGKRGWFNRRQRREKALVFPATTRAECSHEMNRGEAAAEKSAQPHLRLANSVSQDA